MLAPELLELSSDKSKAELRLIPKEHGPITRDDVMRLLSLPEFCSLYPLDQAIDKVVAQTNSLYHQEDGKFELFSVLAERRDGSVKIEISPDKMLATMTLTAPVEVKRSTYLKFLLNLKKIMFAWA